MNLKKFNIYQQEVINKSISNGIDPSSFAKPHINEFKMQIAARALEENINLSKYLEDFDFYQLNEIRLTLKSKLNVTEIAKKGLSYIEMQTRRLNMLKNNLCVV